jgi:hypothetical protein
MKRYGSFLTKEFKDVRAAYPTQSGAARLKCGRDSALSVFAFHHAVHRLSSIEGNTAVERLVVLYLILEVPGSSIGYN